MRLSSAYGARALLVASPDIELRRHFFIGLPLQDWGVLMSSLKQKLGWVPSQVVNSWLSSTRSREVKSKLVQFSCRHPNWLQGVHRHVLADTNFGFPIWCDRWDVIGQTILSRGEWESLLSRTILACLKPGDLAIDVGANMGYDTMLMSSAVGPKGTVLAIEPDHQNLALLLRNLRLLDYQNVVIHSSGLGDEQSFASIAIADAANRGTSNLRPGANGASQPLLVQRLDHILNTNQTGRINFLKMDIEGFEHKAILGMGSLIDQIDCLTCEVDPNFLRQCGSSADALFDTLLNLGFKSYCAQPNSVDKWFLSGADFRISSERSHHFDALFCRNVGVELQKLTHAPS